MFIAILLNFFVTHFANFIYSELPNSIQALVYSEPYKRFKMQFLMKRVNGFEPRGVFRTGQYISDGAF